jgi:superfamily I DNA and/or RNA helicase
VCICGCASAHARCALQRLQLPYTLQIQSGEGYDLNVSLFERLVKEGIQFQALGRQHRMQPAISRIVRDLTYPHLEDAEHVHDRQPLLGVGSEAYGLKPTDSVFLVSHEWAESADADAGASAMDSASRVNVFESLMVIKILKYVLQQGYSMQEVVVLTPYLGQLRMLMQHMQEQRISEMADKRDVDEMERQGIQVEVGCGF